MAYDELADSATWTLASGDGAPQGAGTGATVEVGPLAPGPYTITATVDPGGDQPPASGQATFDVAGCVVSGSLRPESGQYIPQPLALSATESTDSCGRELRYFWECESDTTPECAAFVAASNADDYTHSITEIQINTFDEIAITLTVCAVDPTYDPTSDTPTGDCDTRIIKVYYGAVTSVNM